MNMQSAIYRSTSRLPAIGSAVFFTLIALSLPASTADGLDIASTLEAHKYVLKLEDEGINGPGATWLLGRATEARFTLLGEKHHTSETPRLTTALLHELKPAGYEIYVVESGPESTRILKHKLQSEGLQAGKSLLGRLPFSIAFLDRREELQAMMTALNSGYDVWGIDQEFVGSPRLLFERLLELVDSDEEFIQIVEGLLKKEQAAFDRFASEGNHEDFLLANGSVKAFNQLEQALPHGHEEAKGIVEQLQSSATIYRAFGEQRYYDNNFLRSSLIKENFLNHLRQSSRSPMSEQKALIKMGAIHAGRGRTPMHVYDIGNFAAELAFASDSVSFHVLVLAKVFVDTQGERRSLSDDYPHLKPIFELADEIDPVVFDLEPLRPLLTQQALGSQDLESLRDLALRYDGIVLFPVFTAAEAIGPDSVR